MTALCQKEKSQLDTESSRLTEKILNLTLEIIYLLTGEDYILVRTCGELVTPRKRPRVLEGWSRIQSPITEPPPPSVENCDKKILEVANKITELLTGEVPVRCQDVAVYLSMEEREYLEEQCDLYKAAMMEEEPPLTSPDGSRKRNPPERCPRPLYSPDSAQEEHSTPQQCEHKGTMTEVCPDIKEEKPRVQINIDGSRKRNPPERCPRPLYSQDSAQEELRTPQQYWHKEAMTAVYANMEDEKPHALSPQISTDGSRRRIPAEKSPLPLLPEDSTQQEQNIPKQSDELHQDYQDENVILVKVGDEWGVQQEFLSEISADGQYIRRKYSANSLYGETDNGVRAGKTSVTPAHTAPHGGGSGVIPTHRTHCVKKPHACTLCGKSFAQKSGLGRHEKIHAGQYDYKCSHCEKSFTLKSYLVVHERIHTNEKPYSCSVCGKRFNQKPNLLIHERIHSDVKPYTCAECGKCFKHKSSFTLHEQLHVGTKPHSCPHCGKCFSKKSSLVSHERRHLGQKPLL